jgi:hypothetical protein
VIQICAISRFEFCRIDLQRGRFLFLHSLDPFPPVVSVRFPAVTYTAEASNRERLLPCAFG